MGNPAEKTSAGGLAYWKSAATFDKTGGVGGGTWLGRRRDARFARAGGPSGSGNGHNERASWTTSFWCSGYSHAKRPRMAKSHALIVVGLFVALVGCQSNKQVAMVEPLPAPNFGG